MTGTHALQTLRDKVAAGDDLPGDQLHTAAALVGPHSPFLTRWGCADLLARAVRGSLDAAKELHETLLPDWKWSVDYSGEISLWHKTGTIALDGGQSNNTARAWLIAILDALIYAASETSDKA